MNLAGRDQKMEQSMFIQDAYGLTGAGDTFLVLWRGTPVSEISEEQVYSIFHGKQK